MQVRAMLCAAAVLGTACVTPVTFDQARQRVLLRASFEFSCPPDKIGVQELASDEGGPLYLGVSGCARRAVYVRLSTGGGALFINDTVPSTMEPMGAPPVAP